MGDTIKYLYEKFILRDFFAKIIPGFVILLSIATILTEKSPIYLITLVPNWNTHLFLLIAGLSWVLGFVAQEIGRWFRVLRTEDPVNKLITLARLKGEEDLKHQRERHVVIKEATGNLAMALVVLLVVSLVKIPNMILRVSVAIGVPALILFVRHRYMAKRQTEIDIEIEKLINKNESEKNPSLSE